LRGSDTADAQRDTVTDDRPGARATASSRLEKDAADGSLFRLWLLLSALGIAGTIFFESFDGKMGEEVLKVVLKCLLPPLITPLVFRILVCAVPSVDRDLETRCETTPKQSLQ